MSQVTYYIHIDFDKDIKEGYWAKKLSRLLDNKKLNDKIQNNAKNPTPYQIEFEKYLTDTFSLIELFPFHSAKYNNKYTKLADNDYLPNQKFVFDVLKERIAANDVMIIISRSYKKWQEVVPELVEYDKCFELSNPQNTSFKPENILKVSRRIAGEDVRNWIKEQ